jgi:hypothetical protein
MKNFDFPYINDSPVDLSGIEGAPKIVPPLRRIIDRPMVSIGNDGETEFFKQKELLECGHIQSPKQDIYGETNATRRRCFQCLKEKEAKQ